MVRSNRHSSVFHMWWFLSRIIRKKDTLCCLTPLEHASVTDVRTCWLENVLEVGAYSAFIGSFALMWFSCLYSFSGLSAVRGQLCSDGQERCHSCTHYPLIEWFPPSATIILWRWGQGGAAGEKGQLSSWWSGQACRYLSLPGGIYASAIIMSSAQIGVLKK